MRTLPYYLFTASILVFLLLPFWVQNGMFSDGTLYAAIAQNMAEGLGSLWQPKSSYITEQPFFEHPTLVFGLQSLFFKIFGNSYLTERIYCAFFFIINSLSIFYLWKKNNFTDKTMAWLPVLLFGITPLVFWSFRHNMLENTMLFFDFWAVYFFYESDNFRKDFWKIAIGSFFVFLAVLSKGLVGLFPFAVFFGQWIILKKGNVFNFLIKTFLSVFIFVLCFGLLFFFSKDAYLYLSKYFDIQLLSSLSGKRGHTNGGNRLFIFWRLLKELLPMFLLYLIVKITLFFKNKKTFFSEKIYSQEVIFWLYLGLAASLPLIVSPRQHAYYLVPSFPYFAIAAAMLTAHYLTPVLDFFNGKKMLYFSSILFVISLLCGFSKFGDNSRDNLVLQDIYMLKSRFSDRQIVGFEGSYCEKYSLRSYLLRFAKIDVVCNEKTQPIFISRKEVDLNHEFYKEINCGLQYFRLWEKVK